MVLVWLLCDIFAVCGCSRGHTGIVILEVCFRESSRDTLQNRQEWQSRQTWADSCILTSSWQDDGGIFLIREDHGTHGRAQSMRPGGIVSRAPPCPPASRCISVGHDVNRCWGTRGAEPRDSRAYNVIRASWGRRFRGKISPQLYVGTSHAIGALGWQWRWREQGDGTPISCWCGRHQGDPGAGALQHSRG